MALCLVCVSFGFASCFFYDELGADYCPSTESTLQTAQQAEVDVPASVDRVAD